MENDNKKNLEEIKRLSREYKDWIKKENEKSTE